LINYGLLINNVDLQINSWRELQDINLIDLNNQNVIDSVNEFFQR
jgi:hypothetical protein